MKINNKRTELICVAFIVGVIILSAPPYLWSEVNLGEEAYKVTPGEAAYKVGIEELELLTIQELLAPLAESGKMFPREDILLMYKIKRQIGTKRLLGKKLYLQPSLGTWMGPKEYKYHDTVNDPMMVTTVTLMPPSAQRKPTGFKVALMDGGLLIFNKDGGYEDILIGKQYFDLAFRRLEAGPKERYLKTIGDEMVYLEPTKNFYGHFGFFFEDKWLGKNVVFALIPPLSPTYSRKRLNPETSEPEVVEYSRLHFVDKIIRADEIVEISYSDKTGVETGRDVYRNDGDLSSPVKGILLDSYRTKAFFFSEDPRERKLERDKIAEIELELEIK